MAEKPLKILYFVTSLESGGSERQLVSLLRGLPGGDYEKHVVCLSGYGLLEPEIRPLCTALYDLKYPRLRRNGRLLVHRLPQVFLPVPRLARIIRRVRPDIVHTLIPVCNVMGGFAWKLAGGRPVLVSSRLSLGNYRDSNALFSKLENITDRFFHLVHCKSRGILEDVLQREPFREEQLRVVYNGIDLKRFGNSDSRPRARERLGASEKDLLIATVANLNPYKGHAEIVDAAPKVLEAQPDVRFLFIGRDDGIADGLKERAVCLGVAEHFDFLGERNDVHKLMGGMDLLVSASHEEGFSNVLLEAMASRVPVVATRVGGNPEAVDEGKTGLLANPRDPDSLALAINEVLSLPDHGKSLGEAGRERVERHFSNEAIMAGMKRFYTEALAARNG